MTYRCPCPGCAVCDGREVDCSCDVNWDAVEMREDA